MSYLKSLAAALALLVLGTVAQGETLFFFPQPDTDGVTDYSWFVIDNWFRSDGAGGLIPAFRPPHEEETAVLGDRTEADTTIRIKTLIVSNNVPVFGGNFAVEDLQLLSGSSFNDSTINLLSTMTVGGTNCVFSGVDLTILQIAKVTFSPVPPAQATRLVLTNGSSIANLGLVVMKDQSELFGGGMPECKFGISPGAALATSGKALVNGTATNSLVIDNSGVIRADDGTATFANGLIWGSSAGYGVFQATATNSQLLFTGPLQIPTGAMSVFIGPGTNRWLGGVFVGGNVQVGSGGPNSGNLEIRSSSSGVGTITVAAGGQANWMAGEVDVSRITVAGLGALTISAPTAHLIGANLDNSGFCTLVSTNLFLDGSIVNNEASGLFDLAGPGDITTAPLPAPGYFNDLGTLVKTGSGVTRFLSVDLNNQGMVNVVSGELDLMGGSSLGQFQTETNALLWFSGGTHTLNSGTAFTGSGIVRVSQGSAPAKWFIAGNTTAARLDLGTNGLIEGPLAASVDLLTVTNLTVGAGGVIRNGGLSIETATVSGANTITGATMVVSKAISWNGPDCRLSSAKLTISSNAVAQVMPSSPGAEANLVLDKGTVITNQAVFTLGEAGVISGGGLPKSRLSIQPGAFLVSTGLVSVVATNGSPLVIENRSTVRAASGTLRFFGDLEWQFGGRTGFFEAVDVSSVIDFSSLLQIPAGSVAALHGAGTHLMDAGAKADGVLQLGAPQGAELRPGHLTLSSDVLGTGAVRVLGAPGKSSVLTWQAGTMGCSQLIVDQGALMNLAGPNLKISACSATNSGSLTMGATELVMELGAVLENAPGGVVEVNAAATFRGTALPSGGAVVNRGTFSKSNPGLAQFAGPTASQGPDFTNLGDLLIGAGELHFSGSWRQTAGTTSIEAGATLSGEILNLLGGWLSGPGAVGAQLINSGQVTVGLDPGTLEVRNGKDYQQQPGGVLGIQLAGHNPGIDYDQLLVSGAAKLAGTLDVQPMNGFAPKSGDSFRIVSSAALSGVFNTVSGPVPDGMSWMTTYTSTNVVITLVATIRLPAPIIKDGALTFSFGTASGYTYVVERTKLLMPADWKIVKTFIGDGTMASVLEPVTEVEQFYHVYFYANTP